MTLVRTMMATCVLAMSLATVGPAAARDDASALSGEETGWVGTPPPADCQVEPTTSEAVLDVLRQPLSEDDLEGLEDFPLVTPNESDLPSGKRASAKELEVVSAAFWTATACLNAGDFPGFFACLSERGVSAFMVGLFTMLSGEPAAQLTETQLSDLEESLGQAFGDEPEPLAEDERARIDGIRDGQRLDDGRILIFVDGTIGEDATIYALFSEEDDRWLMDALGQIAEMPAGL